MARELPIQNGRLTTDLDADGHKIKNLSGGTSSVSWDDVAGKPTFANVATSGSYDDLSNKPTIPAAQIQSDWNQTNTGSADFIKNKPSTFPPSSHTHAQGDVTGLEAALDSKLSTASAIAGLTDWTFDGLEGCTLVSFEYRTAVLPGDDDGYYAVVSKEGLLYSGSVSASESATSVTVVCHEPDDEQPPIAFTATRTRLPTMADLALKADKSEMSVTPGTGANADKTTIQLKTGTSATVLTSHQT